MMKGVLVIYSHIPGHSNNAATVSSVGKPTPPSVFPPMDPAAVAPRVSQQWQ